MKKLTMNRLAFSGIRANKKDYLLLGISAFLAIFAAVSTVLGALALMQAATDRRNGAYGSEDAFVFDVQSVPENIPGVRQYGCVTVLGQVKDFPVGYYDEAAQRILNRRCMEGRLPEKAGEAAVDLTALERLQPGAQVGDSLVVPFTAKSKTETRQYRIVGILQPQFADDTREDFLSAVPDSSLAMPEILVSSQEGGSAVNRHLVVIFSGKGGMEALSAAFPENSCRGVDWFGDIYETEPFYGFWAQFRENINISASLLLGGACLLGGSLIGILEATGGQFDRKRQQYAIYRTIGATRHQLRSISSREAMVLSALLCPAAVGCAFLLVWGMCRIFPDSLHFAPRVPWVLGAALGSFLLVWLAARLPADDRHPESGCLCQRFGDFLSGAGPPFHQGILYGHTKLCSGTGKFQYRLSPVHCGTGLPYRNGGFGGDPGSSGCCRRKGLLVCRCDRPYRPRGQLF